MVKDTPMKLKSIADWQKRGTGKKRKEFYHEKNDCTDSIMACSMSLSLNEFHSMSLIGRRCLNANLLRGYHVVRIMVYGLG